MSDDLGLSAGAKGISEGFKTGREAGKEIAKNIEDVQKEAIDLARQKRTKRYGNAEKPSLEKNEQYLKLLRSTDTERKYRMRSTN